MSLKTAHILFVITATLLSLAGAWCSWRILGEGGAPQLKVVLVVSLVVAAVLPVYGVWFYRKLCRRPTL